MRNVTARFTMVALLAGFLACGLALAEPGERREHVDARHLHNHSYLDRGVVVAELPRGANRVRFGAARYWYAGGVWYEAQGPSFLVVAPPVGVVVEVLPPYFTTVRFGAEQYYYANDTYYLWRERERTYEVVPEPQDQQATVLPPEAQELYIYPKGGQDAARQAQDRYECHRWAADQTGFDPTRPAGGVAPEQAAGKHGEYQRAMTACLEARGYSVK